MSGYNTVVHQIPIIVCSTIGGEIPNGEDEARKKFSAGDVVFAIIDGITVLLPSTAKYIMQDKYHRWYFSSKYPQKTKDDWFAEKRPIQYTSSGKLTLLQSNCVGGWGKTRHKTMFKKLSK